MTSDPLRSWQDGRAKQAILHFVERVRADDVPIEDRVAVFDNDGTLWCEQPLLIQFDFVMQRFAEMADAAPELRQRQSWKAAGEHDVGWFHAAMAGHCLGDDTRLDEWA